MDATRGPNQAELVAIEDGVAVFELYQNDVQVGIEKRGAASMPDEWHVGDVFEYVMKGGVEASFEKVGMYDPERDPDLRRKEQDVEAPTGPPGPNRPRGPDNGTSF